MKNVKMDPIGTAMSAIFVVASLGLVATLPTVAQSSAQPEARVTAPARRPATQNAPRPNEAYGPPDGGPSGPPPCPDGPPPDADGKAHGRMLGDLLRDLQLDGKQQDGLNALMDSERRQMDAVHEQIRKIHEKTRTGVDALLTAAQRQKLEQMEKEMERNRPDGPPPGGPNEQR